MRGNLLTDLAVSLNLRLENHGATPIYQCINASSIIDLTFTRLNSGQATVSWEVLSELNSGSDHFYIETQITPNNLRPQMRQPGESAPRNGWSTKQLDRTALSAFLQSTTPIMVTDVISAEQAADNLSDYLTSACNASMPRRRPPPLGRRQAHWWNNEIATLRSETLRIKRSYQRAFRRRDLHAALNLRNVYREKRKDLGKAILTSQRNSWSELCKAVDADPWGLPYKVVTKRLGQKRSGIESLGREEEIADHLFPRLPATDWNLAPQI